MHPNAAFRWHDESAMRAMVASIAFGSLFAATPDGPRVAHLPVTLAPGGLQFHLAKGNGITRHLAGATALFVVNGPDAYISPDWYGLGPDEVPTWNYVAVECEGVLRRLGRDELLAQIDALAQAQEGRLAPKPPWRRDKVGEDRIEALLRGITGFEMRVAAWRGTVKLGQNKEAAARLAAADGVEAAGSRGIAHLMRTMVA